MCIRDRRIGELLESGQFASNLELAEAAGYERSLLSEKLWHLYHDLSEDARKAGYLSCLSEIKGNGFPEETRRLTEQLSDPAFRQTLKEEYACLLYTSAPVRLPEIPPRLRPKQERPQGR